jgi:hypothetical protein
MNEDLIKQCKKSIKLLKKQLKSPYDHAHKSFLLGQILVYEIMLIHLK